MSEHLERIDFFPQQSHEFLYEIIENLIQGIILVTEEKEVVYINNSASKSLQEINRIKRQDENLPEELWSVCQALLLIQSLFPEHCWSLASEVCIEKTIVLRIYVESVQLDKSRNRVLLLRLEDQFKPLKEIAHVEAHNCQMTSRETEVWLLHEANYTYKQIAAQLNISQNTVKKHITSIYRKQKRNL